MLRLQRLAEGLTSLRQGDENEVIVRSRVQNLMAGGDARITDRPGRQTLDLVGIIRRWNRQVRVG